MKIKNKNSMSIATLCLAIIFSVSCSKSSLSEKEESSERSGLHVITPVNENTVNIVTTINLWQTANVEGGIAIVRCLASTGDIVFPEEIDGVMVVQIGSDDLKTNIFGDTKNNVTSINLLSVVGLKKISPYAFSDCINLERIYMPNGLTDIGEGTFQNCSKINDVTIPGGVTVINNFVFQKCTNLSNLSMHNNITRIGNYAFESTTFTYLDIPNVTRIGFAAFWSSNLEEINMPLVRVIDNYCFYFSTKLKKILIPESTTFVGMMAFDYCINVTELIVRSTVAQIWDKAFSCNSLITVYIPSGVTFNSFITPGGSEIGGSFFGNATQITQICTDNDIELKRKLQEHEGHWNYIDKVKVCNI